jgi:hypothetical protein
VFDEGYQDNVRDMQASAILPDQSDDDFRNQF